MKNKLIFIRHAKTLVDKNIPIENWILTNDGQEQANSLVENNLLYADILISSREDKAHLTIKPLADKLNKEIIKIEDLGEIKRPNSEKITKEEYEELKTKIFTDLDFSSNGWETANHALKRFTKAIEEIDKKYQEKTILICAHGTVMTLYFAFLQNKLSDLFFRWKNLEFGAIGIVENGKVTKDIV